MQVILDIILKQNQQIFTKKILKIEKWRDKNEIELYNIGDYFLPNLAITETKGVINKYGYLRLNYLKNYKKALYIELLLEDKLTDHLVSVSSEAENKVKFLIESYRKIDKLTEKNKANNQLEWVKMMNNYKNIAEEIVLKELIYNQPCEDTSKFLSQPALKMYS